MFRTINNCLPRIFVVVLSVMKKLIVVLIVALFVCNTVSASKNEDRTFDVTKNLEIFNSLFKELTLHYVDTVNAEKVIKAGINGMLKNIDPYTVYIPEESEKDFKFMTTGEYGGIGAIISYRDDYVIINEPYENMPANKAGLLPGDKIAFIDNENMKGKNTVDVSNKLKGTPGTKVELKVFRQNNPKPIKFEIVRENIYLNPVPYYGMVTDSIGYICLSNFTANCSDEVKKAYLDLHSKGMKSLILDLSKNPGGLINEACEIVNMFVPKGETVVTTKGRGDKTLSVYKTPEQPMDTEIPLAIIVDSGSASASEIVSGALQDMDRAVIVGERTFGKGLVQGTYPVSFNGQLKVTTAKYYTPSGRCIQAIKYSGNDSEPPVEVPDSLTSEFKTASGRIVRDGRGITPDISVEPLQGHAISYNLYAKNLIFDFANEYYFKNPKAVPMEEFALSDSVYEEFKNFVLDKKFEYELPTKSIYDELLESAKTDEIYNSNKALFDSLQAILVPDIQSEMDLYKPEISKLLLIEMAKYYYFRRGEMYMSLKDDEMLEAAIKILSDKNKYDEILNK